MNISQYQGISQATALFGMYLPDHIEQFSSLQVLTADMAIAAGLERFAFLYPDRFTDVGIAEQNLIGLSAGMASEGLQPIAVAQAAFLTMRAFEMNRQYLGYMQNNVVLVGINAGFYLRYFGNTHYAIEDIAIMRTIPGMTILSPADAGSAVVAMEQALHSENPIYIRLTGGAQLPTVYPNTCSFSIGHNICLREGNDITIMATGIGVALACDVAEKLSLQHNIEASVYDICSIKPFDKTTIEKNKDTSLFVTIEEHSIVGGLGSTVAEITSSMRNMPPVLKLGVQDTFSLPGDYDFLLSQHRLTTKLIIDDIILKIRQI